MSKIKSPVWKDTNIYPFSITYSYSLSVRNRFMFFWADTDKGWRKTINLAANLTLPNRLCLVYLYGEAKKDIIRRHLQKTACENVIVLWADYITLDKIKAIKEAQRTIQKIKSWGLKSNTENPFDVDIDLKTFPGADVEKSIITTARDTISEIQKRIWNNGYINIYDEQHINGNESHSHDLFEIAKRHYPYGIESDTTEDYAYKLLHYSKLFACGESGDCDNPAVEKLGAVYSEESAQITMFDMNSMGISNFVEDFRNYCDAELEHNGFVNVSIAIKRMFAKPYGLYECNYYGYCLGIALSEYSRQELYCSDGICTFAVMDMSTTTRILLSIDYTGVKANRYSLICLYAQSEKQKRFANDLISLFPEFKSPFPICVQSSIVCLISWITENVHYDSIERISPEMFELINMRYPCNISRRTERYCEMFTLEKLKELKKKLITLDDNRISFIAQEFGEEKAKLYKNWAYVKGGAVGWLHPAKTVDERIRWYMKQDICRECGNVIHDFGYDVTPLDEFIENTSLSRHTKTARLTKKNVISLNKKLLGRYQTEYLCPRCLAEFCDCSEYDLYEKMQAFREQGCELF